MRFDIDRYKTKDALHIAIVLVGAVAVYITASALDLFELIYEFIVTHEAYEFDEIFIVSIYLLVVLCSFALFKFFDVRAAFNEIENQNKKLQKLLDEVDTLRGILPICANCKKIRDDDGYWRQVETYFSKHSDLRFSHGCCPNCAKKLYPEYTEE